VERISHVLKTSGLPHDSLKPTSNRIGRTGRAGRLGTAIRSLARETPPCCTFEKSHRQKI